MGTLIRLFGCIILGAVVFGATVGATERGALAPARPESIGEQRGPGMGTPTRNRLKPWAQRFINGPAICVAEGDSIWSTSTPRMQYAVAKRWRPARWVGWHCGGPDQIFDCGLIAANNFRSVTPTDVAGNGRWYNGTETVAPLNVNRMTWNSNEPDGNGIFRATFNPTALAAFSGGDWTSNVPLKARMIWWADGTSLPTATFRGRRSNDSIMNNYPGTIIAAASARYKTFEVDIPAGVNGPAGYPSMDIIMTSGVNETGKNWYPIACRFFREGVVGTEFCTLGSIGGATVGTHINQDLCSDARRADYYTAIGLPNLFLIQLGTNGTVSKADLLTMIQNRRSIMQSLGESPLFLLINPYDTGRGAAYHEGVGAIMLEISKANADVAFIDLYQLAGPYATLAAQYLSDGVHPNENGADYFAAVLWTQIAAAATEQSDPTRGSRPPLIK